PTDISTLSLHDALPIYLDLLRPSRRVWRARFADCRLATLEREVLGLVREDDVPGAVIPGLYFEFLRSRRAAPLAHVFAHNRDDRSEEHTSELQSRFDLV